MRLLQKTGVTVIVLIITHTLSFYTFGKSTLMKAIGANYKSYVLQLEGNEFKTVEFISELDPTEEQVRKHFKAFDPFNLKICPSADLCSGSVKTKGFYSYGFHISIRHPFAMNTLNEVETAKEYMAC